MRQRVVKEIRLDRLRANTRRVIEITGSDALFAVVKADAYGHGAVTAARAALAGGARRLCVCGLTEARTLREAGIPAPILNLEPIDVLEARDVPRLGVVPLVSCGLTVRALGAAARRAGRPIAVHLQIETGMGRFGVEPEHALSLAEAIRDERGLALEGAATHFASADDEDPFATARQIERFEVALASLRSAGVRLRYVHAAASVAALRFPAARYSAVRVGIALYGALPGGLALRGAFGLHPALSLRSRVVRVRDLPAGRSVSYGGHFVTRRPTRLAIVAGGYHDGYPLLIGRPEAPEPDRPAALIGGQRCPILGRVTMDYVMVDVTDLRHLVLPGDRVTLLGEDRGARIDVTELAGWANTIPYTILAQLGERTRTRYLDRRARPPEWIRPDPIRRETAHASDSGLGAAFVNPHASQSEIPAARWRREPQLSRKSRR